MQMSIGERIADLRKKQNISQFQLADALEVSRQAVSKWENDLSSPDTLNLIKLADLLNTEVEYLATGRHSTPPPSPASVIIKQVETIEKLVEVEKIVEVEKPVTVEKPLIIERKIPVETIVEKPVYKKVYRTKYVRNPLEFLAAGILGGLIGLLIGILI